MTSGWELTIQDTCPEGVLNGLWEAGIPFCGAHPIDAVTLRIRVPAKELDRVKALLEKMGCQVLTCRAYGLRPVFGRLRRRYALLICGAVCGLLLAVSNLFVWRIDVLGNETVPDGAVVRAMTAAGAGIGSFWPGFDGEMLRTSLLVALPELQWAGVTYHAGAVQVTVREQREAPKVVDNDEPAHIVSDADGVLTHLSVKLGQPAAVVGDTVEKGQLLISGAAKSSIGSTRPVHALGTVQARTRRVLTVQQPAVVQTKACSGKTSTKISLILWGKPINFYIGSSFSGGTCDKIILDYHLCMEDVFSFPVQLVVQRYTYRGLQERELSKEAQERFAQSVLMETLKQQVKDGEIVNTDFAATLRSRVLTMTMKAECLEEIGEEVPMREEELRQIQMENDAGDETTND